VFNSRCLSLSLVGDDENIIDWIAFHRQPGRLICWWECADFVVGWMRLPLMVHLHHWTQATTGWPGRTLGEKQDKTRQDKTWAKGCCCQQHKTGDGMGSDVRGRVWEAQSQFLAVT
jgi:hypothetical protein